MPKARPPGHSRRPGRGSGLEGGSARGGSVPEKLVGTPSAMPKSVAPMRVTAEVPTKCRDRTCLRTGQTFSCQAARAPLS